MENVRFEGEGSLVREYAQKRKAIQIAGKIMEQAQTASSIYISRKFSAYEFSYLHENQ